MSLYEQIKAVRANRELSQYQKDRLIDIMRCYHATFEHGV